MRKKLAISSYSLGWGFLSSSRLCLKKIKNSQVSETLSGSSEQVMKSVMFRLRNRFQDFSSSSISSFSLLLCVFTRLN